MMFMCKRPARALTTLGAVISVLIEGSNVPQHVAAALVQSVPQDSSTLVIRNVTVIDGRGGAPLAEAAVLVRNGRIRAVGRAGSIAVPAGARTMDGAGGFLVPGFVETHAHFALGPVHLDMTGPAPTVRLEPAPEVGRRSLALLLASGITLARDPGGPIGTTVALRDSVERGQLIGPRLKVAGDVIDATRFPGLTATVTTPDEVRTEVRRQAAAGADWIKLYATLGPELVRAGIDEAHALGLPVAAHLMMTTWTEAGPMGLDNIVHILGWSPKLLPAEARPKYMAMMAGTQFMYGWLELLDLDAREMVEAIAALAQNGTHVDPTLVVFERAIRGDDPTITRSPSLAQVPAALVENWRSEFNFNLGWTPDDYRRARLAWPKALQLTKRLWDAGVMLTAGTDANNPWTVPGESWHRELELLVESGIPPADVLVIATRNGAKALGLLDEAGTIEPGKRADLVLLRANPLASISATRTVSWVMKDGIIHRPADLVPVR